MPRNLVSSLVVFGLIIVFLVSGCQQAPAPAPAPAPGPAPAKEAIVLKMVSAWTKTHKLTSQMFYFADLVNERSNGELRIEWAGGPEMVKAREALDALGKGEFDMLGSAPGYYEGAVAEGSILNAPLGLPYELQLPLSMKTFDIVDRVYQEKTKTKLWMSFWTGYHMVFSKEPIRTMDDFKGLRIRGGGGFYGLPYQALGAALVKIPSEEVYVSAQRGVIDARAGNPVSALDYKEYEVLDYIIDYPTNPSTGYFWLNLEMWNKLPQHLKDIMTRSRDDAWYWSYSWGNVSNVENLEKLQQNGMQVIRPTPQESARWTNAIGALGNERMLKIAPNTGPQLLAIADGLR